jgi:hypothetical protein
MEPNTKLMFEELMKEILSMRTEMKEGFTSHEAIFAACDAEFTLAEQQCEKHVMTQESTAAEFDKSCGNGRWTHRSLPSSSSCPSSTRSSTAMPSWGTLPSQGSFR